MLLHKNYLFFFLILFLSCQVKREKLPKNSIISSKFIVLDEKRSPNHVKCEINILPFLEMQEYDCSFKLESMEFDIMSKFKLNDQGKMIEYWRYLSEGPLVYTLKDIIDDKGIEKEVEYKQFSVKVSDDRNQIIDNLDNFEIERVFTKEKLILMKQNDELRIKGLRVIYQYY